MKQRSGRQVKLGDLKHIAVYLPNNVYKAVKERADAERRSMSFMVTILLEEKLGIKK